MNLLDNNERPDEALRRYLRKCKAKRLKHELNFRRALRKLQPQFPTILQKLMTVQELMAVQPMNFPRAAVFYMDHLDLTHDGRRQP